MYCWADVVLLLAVARGSAPEAHDSREVCASDARRDQRERLDTNGERSEP
jgi:hypothetical protein